MTKQRNRRQRKKLHVGEFQELGFTVTAALAAPLDDMSRDRLTDAFLDECVEPNGMLFGGGINDVLDGFVASDKPRGSATDEQREQVRSWLKARLEFTSVSVGPLIDAWYGHIR